MTTIALHDYLQQIEALIEEHRLGEAVDHCRHILQQHPRHIPTYRVLAKVLIEKGEHSDAVDLLNRILSVEPNDFIAHVALSVAYKDLSDIPRSIYHLQRALDAEPYNAALWEELQDLHSLNKTVPPERMAPSSAALARLYLKSEMYAAAIAELRQLLAQNPARIDLKVQLAETVWWANQRVEAVRLALEILDELPNCLSANAILAEIWLQTGRKAEAQTYLKRLQEMTLVDKEHLQPETAVGRAFLVRGAPPIPDSVTIDAFQEDEISVSEEAVLETVDSDWINEFSLADSDELPADETPEYESDWLSEAAASIEEGAGTQPFDLPADPLDEETEWFVDPEREDEESLDDLLGDVGDDAQLDDWLSDLSADSTPEAEPEIDFSGTTGFSGLLGELDEDDDVTASGEGGLAAADEPFAEGLTELFDQMDDTEAAAADSAVGAAPDDEIDDLMAADLAALTQPDEPDEADEHTGYTGLFDELSTDAFPEEPTALDADWLSSDQPDESTVEETPDWLAEVQDDDFEPVQIDNRLASDWLVDLEEPEESEESEAAAAADMDAPADDDWLAELAGEEPEETAVEPEPPAAEASEIPTWMLADEQTDQVFETPPPLDVVESQAFDSDDSVEETAVPTWLLGGDQTVEETGELETDQLAEAEDASPPDEDKSFVAPDAELPDWLQAEQVEEAEQMEAEESEEIEPSTEDPLLTDSMISLVQDEIPDWLRDDEPEIDVDAIPELDSSPELFDDDEKIPDWLLADLSAGQTPAEASVLDDSDKKESIPQEPEEELPDTSSDVSDEDLDWLGQLAESPDAQTEDDSSSFASRVAAGEGGAIEEPPTQVSLPDEQEAAAGEDDLDWLDALSGPDVAPTEEQATLDWSQAEPEIEDMLAGVTGELDADFAGLDTLGEESADELEPAEESAEELDSGTGWLDELAPGSDTGLLEELGAEPSLPDFEDSLAALPEEEEADLSWLEELEEDVSPAETDSDVLAAAEAGEAPAEEPVPEDLDEAMAWLEGLAADQGAPMEELPSLTEQPEDEPAAESAVDLPAEIDEEAAAAPPEPEPEPEAEEMGLPPLDESLDWLEEMSETAPDEDAEFELDLPADALSPVDASLDWLEGTDVPDELSDEEAAEEPALEVEPEEAPEDLDDAMIWLEELAASQGASLDELPGVAAEEEEAPSEPEEAPEDLDDAMAWLEELAAKQGAPLEELPSVSEAEPPAAAPESEAAESAATADLDDAMSWLEDLAVEQESPLEDLPTIADVVDEDLSAEPPQPEAAEVVEPAEDLTAALDWLEQVALEDGSDLADVAVDDTAVTGSEEELTEALDWLERVAQAEEEAEVTEEPVDELDDLAGAMPEDPDEALAWLQQVAAAEEETVEEEAEVEEETAVPLETPPDSSTALPETAPQPMPDETVAEPEAEPQVAEAEEAGSDDIETEILSEMPEDPDAAMAWLERLAAKQGARLEELPTVAEADYPQDVSPVESEVVEQDVELADEPEPEEAVTGTAPLVDDSMEWLDDLASEAEAVPVGDQSEAAEIAEDTTPEPEEALRQADLTELEAPDDVDDAMAWLEALAAQQGAALEELPTLAGVDTAVPESPEPVEAEEEAAPAEPEVEEVAEMALETPELDESPAEEMTEAEVALPDDTVIDDDEIDLSEGVAESMPDWLSADTAELDQMPGQTQWLRALDEPDVTGWLEEEEVTLSSAHDRVVRSRYQTPPDMGFDTGPLPETGPFDLPAEEDTPSVFALDDEQLAAARQAVEDGAFDDAVQTYQTLVAAGGGMMTLIADLESVADKYREQPLFRHLLGDAYMQNGQLQKALDTYRTALDQI